jgi:NADH:ubiquinone oxidoreductase subunit H
MQKRTGPHLVGPFRLLQAITDNLKLLVKKTIILQTANIMNFIAGLLITFNLSYVGWSIINFV